jgi:peptidoglycan/LPS O-acetylase OafA/YrhL
MEKKVQSSSHLLYLDGIRALAAITIVGHHVILQFFEMNDDRLTRLQRAVAWIFYNGHLAVDVFIVLSGFCLMIPVVKTNYTLNGGIWRFYKKRAIRIIPTYYIAIVFSLLLIYLMIGQKTGTHWDISIPVTEKGVLAALLFVSDCFNSTVANVNHVFWSVAVETRIYVIFPVIIYIYNRFNTLITFLLSISLSIILYFSLTLANKVLPIFLVGLSGVSPFIILFVLGMIGADICFSTDKKQRLLKLIPWNKVLLLMAVLFGLFKGLKHLNIVSDQVMDVLVGGGTMALLVVCFKETRQKGKASLIYKVLSWQPLVFIGTFSYSLYLTHAPILQILTQYIIFPLHLSRFTSAILLLFISLPICIAFAYLFFILFERPFLNLGKKLTIKEAEERAAVFPAI